jgi:hypothetical protein
MQKLKLKYGFKSKTGPWPNGSAQPTWLGSTQPARSWIGQTDPVQPLTRTPLPLESLWQTLIASAVACRLRPPLTTSVADTWGKRCTSTPFTPLLQLDLAVASSPRDPLPSLARVPPALVAFELAASPVTLMMLVMHYCGGCGGWTAQVEASPMGAPYAAMPPPVQSPSGRAWSAAWALPRHVGQGCT